MGGYFSYAEQAGHYFRRPHQAPAERAVDSPAAWRGPEMAAHRDWRLVLGAAEVDVVLHARTAYQDHPEPGRRRHLLRLWLSIE